MLANMIDLLDDAERNGYGVGAFNTVNMEFVRGAVRAAEELRSPIILQLAEIQIKDAPLNLMIPMMAQAAKDASVPVAVHYDHGLTLENILKALRYGCTSVMFDGAALPFEENIETTRKTVRMAKAFGASCEAELGVVGGGEAESEGQVFEEAFTDPSQAAEFVQRTGCGALAVAIGNVHGRYVKEPNLQLERLKLIDKIVSVPLVLHGGSGISDDDFRRCIGGGIRKINIFTAVHQSAASRLVGMQASECACSSITQRLEEGAYEEIARHLRIFMSDGKA
jgi:fructose-bisphosphate aldolase class II